MPIEPCAELPGIGRRERLGLFHLMLLQRLFEERVLALYRQGRVPGSVYSGRGQEAVAAGAGLALAPADVVAPLNRELACHFARGVTAADAFRNFLGKGTGPTRGRDGNMHFGAPRDGVFPLVSMLGDLVPVVVGAGLAFKRRGEPRVALTFLGEGGFSVGDTHEGLNLAGLWQVPVVLVIQSNRYSYSTPGVATDGQHEHRPTRVRRVVDSGGARRRDRRPRGSRRGAGGGGAGAERQRPAGDRSAVGAHAGHAAHDDARYVPAGTREEFAERFDPVERLAARLALDGVDDDEIDASRAGAAADVAAGLAEAEAAPEPDPAETEQGVYAEPPFP